MLIELLKMCSYLFLNRERNHTWHISKPFRVDTAQGISTIFCKKQCYNIFASVAWNFKYCWSREI